MSMSSCSIGKPDHHKRRCIKTFMHFGSPILGEVKAVTYPILGVVTPERRTHYPHFGGTSEFLNRKHFPHFGGDILYVAMFVGKIKRSLPLQNGLIKRPKSRSPLRAASAIRGNGGKPPGGIYTKPVSFRGCSIKCTPFCVSAGIYRRAAYIFRVFVCTT